MQDALTQDQRSQLKGELVASSETRPVRFLRNGCALNICTGETCPRGANVMYHPVYWTFSSKAANQIAKWLGAKLVWS